MTDWEQRMAQRAKARTAAKAIDAWHGPSRADLDIPYGQLGGPLPDHVCHQCWGDRYIWLGNTWGIRHIGDLHDCTHACHDGEIWLAS